MRSGEPGYCRAARILADEIEIKLQVGGRRGLVFEAADPPLPFAGFRRLLRAKIVKPGSAMRIDDTERPFLFLEVVQTEDEDDVLDDIGEITGMIDVAIVHGLRSFIPG